MSGRTLVDRYLAELAAATEALPMGRRAELVVEVREHIETALGSGGGVDEVTVRNVLDRLGSPSEIVWAELDADRPRGTQQLPPAAPAVVGRALTWTRLGIAVLTGVVVLLLAVMAGATTLAAAVTAFALAVITPYVWIPLVVSLIAFASRRERSTLTYASGYAPGAAAPEISHRPSPILVGLGAIGVLLLVALIARGAFFMAMVAVLAAPILVLLLVLEVLRGRR